MCLIHPPSQSSSICWLCHSVFVIWLPPLFPSPLLRPPGGADIELVYMIDLPLFENDPSLRCRSDSLFCAVTALWLMTHHLMCLNLLVVFWCLCWFWMCGPPPSHMIGSTCCTPSTASCLTSRAPWLEWHPFLALQSRGDNLGDWKWQMSGQLYSQGGWCLQPASSPLCLSLLCQTVVSISVYSLWTSTEALVRLPRDWARPIFKHTNYFRYNNQMKQKLIAN